MNLYDMQERLSVLHKGKLLPHQGSFYKTRPVFSFIKGSICLLLTEMQKWCKTACLIFTGREGALCQRKVGLMKMEYVVS